MSCIQKQNSFEEASEDAIRTTTCTIVRWTGSDVVYAVLASGLSLSRWPKTLAKANSLKMPNSISMPSLESECRCRIENGRKSMQWVPISHTHQHSGLWQQWPAFSQERETQNDLIQLILKMQWSWEGAFSKSNMTVKPGQLTSAEVWSETKVKPCINHTWQSSTSFSPKLKRL